MSGEARDRWWATLPAAVPEPAPALRFPAARRLREAFSPARAWAFELAAFREEAAVLLQAETDLLGSLPVEEITWGYGATDPAAPPGTSPESSAPRQKREPGAARDARWKQGEAETHRELPIDSPTTSDADDPSERNRPRRGTAGIVPVPAPGDVGSPPPRSSKLSEPVAAGHTAGKVGSSKPATGAAPDPARLSRTAGGPEPFDLLAPEARLIAATWWTGQCGGTEQTPAPAENDAARIVAGLSSLDLERKADPATPEVSKVIAAFPEAASEWPHEGASPVEHSLVEDAGQPRPEREAVRASGSPTSSSGSRPPRLEPSSDWPFPLEPGEAATGSASTQDRSGETTDSGRAPTRTVDLRTSRGGSIGRIPVDVDPANVTAEQPEGATAPREQGDDSRASEEQQVRWLPDEDDLAEQLHHLLRRQARRKGIELT